MIKLIDNSFSLPENIFVQDKENPFLCRILSLYRAYGANTSFADFWIGLDENKKPVSLISRLDSQFTLYLTEQSNLEETAEFIYAVGASAVLCDSKFAMPIKFPVTESGKILVLSGNDTVYESKITIETPPLKRIFELLHGVEDWNFSDFESFYLDLSHKILKGCARVYAVIKNGKPLSCAMTVAESKNAAVIGAVATLEKYRGNGFAGALVNKICAELKNERKAAYVYTQDSKIIGFYEKLGFSLYGNWSEFRLN